MRTRLLSLIACAFLFTGAVHAQTLIHYWNFNHLAPVLTTPVHPNFLAIIPSDTSVTSISGAISYQALTGTAGNNLTYYDTVPGNIINARQAAPAGNGVGFHNPSDSMEIRIYVPCGGYKDVVFKFGGESNNGARLLFYSYSLDSGNTWKTNGMTVNGINSSSDSLYGSWNLHTVAFDTSVGNAGNFVIRIMPQGGSGTSGTTIFDNMSLEGIPFNTGVPSATTQNGILAVYPNPATGNLYVDMATTTTKKLSVYNTTGQLVYSSITSNKRATIPLEGQALGLYYLLVHDTETGTTYSAKFIKE